jgi:hypothetical protein
MGTWVEEKRERDRGEEEWGGETEGGGQAETEGVGGGGRDRRWRVGRDRKGWGRDRGERREEWGKVTEIEGDGDEECGEGRERQKW